MFKVIAHRGASADAPDNTAETFELAIEQEADLIETDVRVSADGVLVLEHDAKVGELEVQYSTLAALRDVKPGLLTVAGAIKQFGVHIPFCFECKAANLEHRLVYLLKDLLSEPLWQQTEFASFNFMSSVACRNLLAALGDPNQVGWLTQQWDEDALRSVQEAGLTQFCPPAHTVLARPHLVQRALELSLNVRVWLVTEPGMVPALADAGVYGGTVNFPASARTALDAAASSKRF